MLAALAWFGFRGGVGIALGAALGAAVAYPVGRWNASHDAAAAAQIEALQSQLAANEIDLSATRAQAQRSAAAAAQNARAAQDAETRNANYEKLLMARTDRCGITDDDRLFLDSDGGRPNPTGR